MDNEPQLQQMPDPVTPTAGRNWKLKAKLAGALAFFLIACGVWTYKTFVAPPENFPVETVIMVKEGEVLSGAADALLETHAIRSRFAFKVFMVLFGGTKGLRAGEYYLEAPQSSYELARRFSTSDFDLKSVKVTIPEGLNVKEIAAIFSKEAKFKRFNSKQFISLASPLEGYLFPDTYFFLPSVTPREIIEAMQENYKSKIDSISGLIEASKRPIADIIKMASILEEEARLPETMRSIAGILWKRFDEKMPLQVDASIVYLTGKPDGNKLVSEDFKIESPYNTYMNLGFPPTPISNPGLGAIKAAVTPTKTKYYFYLTDPNGGFHPAVTYDEHLINKAKYLQ